MDYSAYQEQESSPWATSPKHSRTPSAQQEPPSPTLVLPPPSRGSTSPTRDTSVNGSDSTAVQTIPASPEQHSSAEQAQLPRQDPPLASQPQSQQQRAQRSAQRYHGQRPRSRHELPVYKLQPRVTGLERATRKELNVRFDVYVRQMHTINPQKDRLTETLIDKFAWL